MTDVIFPTDGAIGNTISEPERGREISEQDFSAILDGSCASKPFVLSGMAVTTSGLTATIGTGTCVIDGRYCELNTTQDVTLPTNGDRRVMIEKTEDGGGLALALAAQQENHQQGQTPPPARHIVLARVKTAGGVVTENIDAREWFSGATRSGIYVGDGTNSRAIDIGGTPKRVIVQGVNSQIIGFSQSLDFGARAPDTDFGDQTLGFAVVPGTTFDLSIFDLLRASKDWNPGTLTQDNAQTTTLTVNGASVGDPVDVWAEDIDSTKLGRVFLRGEVTAADVVTVTVVNRHTSNYTFDGKVHVAVPLSRTINVPSPVQTQTGLLQSLRPRITANGFTVDVGAGSSLNANGLVYSWVAHF